jgi:hypothetical protein
MKIRLAIMIVMMSCSILDLKTQTNKVPGVVVNYSPASSKIYIGSPSICILPNGDYIASCNYFGEGSTSDITSVFCSKDRGKTWEKVTDVKGQFQSSLFIYNDAVYLIGTSKAYGNIVIRRSEDGGRTWTTPNTKDNGILFDNGKYHCAPTPVVVHNGRIWRAFEENKPDADPLVKVPLTTFMISAPANADLLNAESWRRCNTIRGDRLHGGQWFEGNAVVSPTGELLNILRTNYGGKLPEKAAVIVVDNDGRTAEFKGMLDMPGAQKKFTIRYDENSQLYWAITTIVREEDKIETYDIHHAEIRNTLSLISSVDLKHWTVRKILIHHPDHIKHGFQYVDWVIENNDIIAVCRTSYDDEFGGADSYHNSNYMTFHRISNFRNIF